MPSLSDVTAYLDTYLELAGASSDDPSWNGLQVEGDPHVSVVAVAVDAGLATFAEARKLGAQFLLVHHGLFWEFDKPSLVGWRKERVEVLRTHNISLYAAHLPLDRHPEVGNNAALLKLVGATRVEDFLLKNSGAISGIGQLPSPLSLKVIEETLTDELGAVCTTLPFGRKKISRIAVASGHGGYGGFYEALEADVDLYITGDTCEVYQTAKDAGLNVIFAGHYATETLGVKALAAHLATKFKLKTHFIDIPTGL